MTDLKTSRTDEILDEVAAWIERRDRDDWGDADQAALDNWVAQSPAHLVAFLRADNAWKRADRLTALKAGPADVRPSNASASHRRIPAAFRNAALLAAICLLGATASAYLMQPSEDVYATPVGGHTVLSLADGSKVELNTDTVLRIKKSGTQRLVKLDKGEAFFDVRHDAAHPFIVLAADHRVTDLGTKFIVRDRNDRLEVTLIEGRAQIEASGPSKKSAVLTKGDVAIATANTLSVLRQSDTGLSRSAAWRHGVIVFDNMTLARAASEFNRYNTHKLIVVSPDAARMTIVGTFHTNDVKGFAEIAQDILHLRVETNGNQTVLSR